MNECDHIEFTFFKDSYTELCKSTECRNEIKKQPPLRWNNWKHTL